MEIHSLSGPLPPIPDNLTIPQFIFDCEHITRPTREPGTPWLIDDTTGRAMGRDELRKRTLGLANTLHSKYGIRDGDVVLLFSRNHIDYPVAMWATHMLGGVISGANPDFLVNELLYQTKATSATMIFAHPEALPIALEVARMAGLPPDRVILFNVENSTLPGSKQDTINDLVNYGLRIETSFSEKRLEPGEAKTKLAFLSFSSGTTGRPKAVAIPHYALIANVIQMAVHNKINENYCAWEDQRYRSKDVAIGVLPLYHIYGLVVNLHFILYCAMTLVVVPKFNFIGMLDSIIRHRITHLLLVPPQVVLLCKHEAVKRYDLRPYIRFIMCGAAPLSHELNQQLFEMFPDAHIGQGYGMTETCTVTTMWPITPKRGKPGSSGSLVPGTVARVVKPDGSLAAYDEPGELVIRTPSVALGYTNNEHATKERFIDGWVRTGDEVQIDKAGEVKVLDRLKEIMKVKGLQVAPAELEGCLLDHPDVSNACVVGVPDDYNGELPLAFVVLNKEAAKRVEQDPRLSAHLKASIIKYVADNKVSYKHLAGGVEFVSAIPTSPSGKLLRRVLRDQAREARKARVKL